MEVEYRHIIRDYMNKQKMTVTKLSRISGLGRVNLGNKIKGETTMTVEEFIKIARILEFSEKDLIRSMR